MAIEIPRSVSTGEAAQRLKVSKVWIQGSENAPFLGGVVAEDIEWVYPIAEKARELKSCKWIHSDPSLYATPLADRSSGMDFFGYSLCDGSYRLCGCDLKRCGHQHS